MRGTVVLPHYNVNYLRPFPAKAHHKSREMSNFADIDIDPAIVRRASKGDAKAHEIIYRAYCAPVYSVCLRFTRVPANAEDLLQETFIQVIRSIAGFRGDAPLGLWIRRIAISKALMFLRSAWHSRGQSLEDDWEDAAPAGSHQRGNPAQPEQAMDLDAALGNLPPVSRAVVWLHDVEGFTHKEIAGLMGKTESFSKSQLSRAYLRLRPMLDAQLERDNSTAAMQGSVLGSC